ncbi:gem-associated protein 2 [Sitophilus oryzae]|uniref:Gem-associated protein 2 n=1 Tax=Sitophilus oryzae TaxID=7048 RepID=A0A6J2XQ65_SITOR|nr:gem-associated protein 2 [Sitophilus oryzae]
MYLSDSESSSDESGIQKKALDVCIPENFDPNSIPQTGEEYLQHVIYERTKKCKKWVTAKADFTKFTKNQTVHINKDVATSKALDKFYPTKDWQDNALKDFIQLRNFVNNSKTALPLRDRFRTEDLLRKIHEAAPKFSEITQYSQAAKVQLLQDITNTLKQDRTFINNNVGSWIYAILVLLEKPLTPDCCFKLREFTKICADIRAGLSDSVNEEVAAPLNLYICIIARYFNQLDLAD